MLSSFCGSVTETGGLTVFVYPGTHMVESMLSCVTVLSIAPGVHFGSGRVSLIAWHICNVVCDMYWSDPWFGCTRRQDMGRVKSWAGGYISYFIAKESVQDSKRPRPWRDCRRYLSERKTLRYRSPYEINKNWLAENVNIYNSCKHKISAFETS